MIQSILVLVVSGLKELLKISGWELSLAVMIKNPMEKKPEMVDLTTASW